MREEFGGGFLRRCLRRRRIARMIRKTRIMAPRAMPTFAPRGSPEEWEEEDVSDVSAAPVAVAVGVMSGVVTVAAQLVETGESEAVVEGGSTVPPEGKRIAVLAVTESADVGGSKPAIEDINETEKAEADAALDDSWAGSSLFWLGNEAFPYDIWKYGL